MLRSRARQIDRRLRERKRRIKRWLYGMTRPGSLLKHLIPLKTDHWDVATPGYLEIDLVSHSGASAAGECLHTLDSVDMHTTWVERQAVMGKSRHEVVRAMTTIEHQLPFSLRGVDCDNGSAFINDHLWAWCRDRPGRPFSSRARGPIRRMTTRMWSRRTGPTCANSWAGSGTTCRQRWRRLPPRLCGGSGRPPR